MRLDFAYHQANLWRKKVRELPDLSWKSLSDVADCWRGEIDSPIDDKAILHTTNFTCFQPDGSSTSDLTRNVQRGDIIVKRVARNCADSFIPYYRNQRARCSDCILIIRPKDRSEKMALIFALRVLVASRKGAALIEHGIGASYIPLNTLNGLQIPVNLCSLFPELFTLFTTAVMNKNLKRMEGLEERVRAIILGTCIETQDA
jgi:hypothetical protein